MNDRAVEIVWRAGFRAGTEALDHFVTEIDEYARPGDMERMENEAWEKARKILATNDPDPERIIISYSVVCPKCKGTTAYVDDREEGSIECIHCGLEIDLNV